VRERLARAGVAVSSPARNAAFCDRLSPAGGLTATTFGVPLALTEDPDPADDSTTPNTAEKSRTKIVPTAAIGQGYAIHMPLLQVSGLQLTGVDELQIPVPLHSLGGVATLLEQLPSTHTVPDG
jgi:hypothetical protein